MWLDVRRPISANRDAGSSSRSLVVAIVIGLAIVATPGAAQRYFRGERAEIVSARSLLGVWRDGNVANLARPDGSVAVLEPVYFADGDGPSMMSALSVSFAAPPGASPRRVRVSVAVAKERCFALAIGLRRWTVRSDTARPPIDTIFTSRHCVTSGPDPVVIDVPVGARFSAGTSQVRSDGRIEVVLLVESAFSTNEGQEKSERHIDEVVVETDY